MNMGEKVKYYFDHSGDTSYFLERETGIRAKAIDNIRSGNAKPKNLKLKTVFLALAYFQGTEFERETLGKIRTLLESDITSYRMAHMLVFKGDDGHEHLPSMQSIDMLRQGKKKLADITVMTAERFLTVYDMLQAEEPIK